MTSDMIKKIEMVFDCRVVTINGKKATVIRSDIAVDGTAVYEQGNKPYITVQFATVTVLDKGGLDYECHSAHCYLAEEHNLHKEF